MMVPITLPELGVADVRLSLWFVALGDSVVEGDRVIELVTDGAVIELTAPATGRLCEKRAWANDCLAPGQVLGVIEAENIG
jgi:pyruvate/2-oxoglutarate dehydrogenase complex dihydrolipoamide acyltransferase (E2) component